MGLRPGDSARLALRNIRRRSVLPLFLALLVPSASIAAPMAMGDMFQTSLREDIYGTLGAVDEVVRSQSLFRPEVFRAMGNDTALAGMTDGLAPLLVLQAAVNSSTGTKRDPQAEIVGVDGSIAAFGAFRDRGGARLPAELPPGEAYLREDSAARLGAKEGDTLIATIAHPGYSIESVYSPANSVHRAQFLVRSVIMNGDLGAFSLAPRGEGSRAVFVNLTWLGEAIGESGLNAVIVSNTGDARAGAGLTDQVTKRLNSLLGGVAGHEDGGFAVTAARGYVRLDNERVFFGGRFAEAAAKADPRVLAVSRLVSYFVNAIETNDSRISYSTVTALDPGEDSSFGKFVENSTGRDITGSISDDEIIVTNYTASRLGISVGDRVRLNYTLYDRYFRQTLVYEEFTVRYIVDLTGKADDPDLMPPFPGIRGKASCGDWRPPIPINYSIMVPEDLSYWFSHGGTPKAYITLARGMKMWGNDLGNLTTVKLLPAPGASESELAPGISRGLNSTVPPGEWGVFVDPIKRRSLDSVRGLDIVTQALEAFATAVAASGMVLIAVAVQTSLAGRRREIGVLRSMGFTRRSIVSLFLIEGTLLALGASALGTGAGVAFAGAGITVSGTLWSAILPVQPSFHAPGTPVLIAGFVAGALLSALSFAAGARSASKGSVVSALRDLPPAGRGGEKARWTLVPAALGAVLALAGALAQAPYRDILLLCGPPLLLAFAPANRRLLSSAGYIASVVWVAAYGSAAASGAGDMLLLYYFLSGNILLLVTVNAVCARLSRFTALLSGITTAGRISLRGPARSIGKTGAFISVYALVVFPILTLAAYLPAQAGNFSSQVEVQGGGYDIIGVTAAPVFFDVGDGGELARHNITGLPEAMETVQFLGYGDPGGTCTNLNPDAPPRLLAANSSFVSGSRIPFVETGDGTRGRDAWRLLESESADGAIPAVGDYTTVVWIYGKGLGGTITITDEQGRPVVLRIVGILHDSIFQGSVFVSESAMRRLYPTQSVYNHFLFRGVGAGDAAALEEAFSEFGMRARPVKDVVADSMRVESAYISILYAMLVSGIIIGTLGFAAKVARETRERRFEMGVMRAIGFRRRALVSLLLAENLFIFALGFGTALLAAVTASWAFLGTLPPAADTLLLLGLLAAVVSAATLVPLLRAARMTVAECVRITE